MRSIRGLALALAAVMLAPIAAGATDQPIGARKLIVKKRLAGGERLVFVSRDPAFLFPVIGGADDPTTGSPGGAQLDLVTETDGSATLTAPAGLGRPGWRAKTGGQEVYKFADPPGGTLSDLRVIVLRKAKLLKIVAKASGLALDAPLGAVGVRLTTGSLRSCARFDQTTIRRDEPGRYVAKGAAPGALADCSDASLAGLPPCGDTTFPECGGICPAGAVCSSQDLATCTCVSSASPCGTTAPVCNGTCPTGEECVAVGPGVPFNDCTCTPVGVTPCGASGYPTCGGACPEGSAGCGAFSAPSPGFGDYCACGGCGDGPPCPLGFRCADVGGGALTCVPIPCTGGSPSPTCGGTCPAGLVCGAVQYSDVAFAGCFCGPPSSCDSACGGFVCDPGHVCVVDSMLSSCGCQ
jgi:hypothetical protein